MANFDVQQAKEQLSKLIERALNGEEVVITQAGKVDVSSLSREWGRRLKG
jgi:prevent-host-death family protein